jgi:putative aldouronate transport system permease protein
MQLESTAPTALRRRPSFLTRASRYREIYLIMLPGLAFFLIFRITPLFGRVMAFMDYSVVNGFAGSEWVGLRHFERFFTSRDFWVLTRNTFWISGLRILWGFPVPIIFSLFLNDFRNQFVKRMLQSTIYLPHFVSWPVVASLTILLLAPDVGPLNIIIERLTGDSIFFLVEPEYFRPLLVLQGVWKEAGWGTVIYLAALANVDPGLYESAMIDGANRFQRTLHITLPALFSTAIILFILQLGRMVNENFQQIFLMLTPLTYDVGDVYETYVYRVGLQDARFGLSTAVGTFKAVVAFIMIMGSDWVIKRTGARGVV